MKLSSEILISQKIIKDIALIHYNNALKLTVEEDKYSLSDTINTRIKQLQNGMDYSFRQKSDPLVSLVKISRSITALTDIDELLKVIAEETKKCNSGRQMYRIFMG